MKRIAITGSSGYIGQQLVAGLATRPGVERILGLDIRPPAETASAVFTFAHCDIRNHFDSILTANQIDTAVHLAVAFDPTFRRSGSYSINVDGTRRFLESCRRASVRRAVVLSSASAYGAHPDNPERLTESHPLRAGPAFTYAYDKRLCDEVCSAFASEHPEFSLAWLRPPLVFGPGVDNYVARMFFKPKVVFVRGFDPPMQFIDCADLCDAIIAVMASSVTGPLNVAPDDTLTLRQLAAEFKRAPMSLPLGLARGLAGLTYYLGIRSINEGSPGAIPYICHRWVIDSSRLRNEVGYACRLSSIDTIRTWRRDIVERAARGRPLPGKIRLSSSESGRG